MIQEISIEQATDLIELNNPIQSKDCGTFIVHCLGDGRILINDCSGGNQLITNTDQ
jgi:hypothetical protein